MAFTNVGFDGTVTEGGFAELLTTMMEGGGEQYATGFVPSSTAGTNRPVSIASGVAWVAGVLVKQSAATTVTCAANSSGNPRIDVVTLQVDWSTNTSSYVVVQGTPNANPVAPSVTQSVGTSTSVWQMPIARVRVNNGATTLSAGNIEDVRPGRERVSRFSATPSTPTIGSGSSGVTVATIDVPNPGWQQGFRLDCSAYLEFATITSGVGYGQIEITIDGATLTGGRAPNLNVGPAIARPELSAVYFQAVTARLVAIPHNMTQSLEVQSQYSGFTVRRIPA